MSLNRKEHWEQVYRSKSPLEVSWHQTEPRLSLELIRETGASVNARIIDVGGGASVLVDRLYAQGHRRLAVLDISAAALSFARQRLGSAGNELEWYEADVTSFQPPHSFDVWHDRAVFHFLTDGADRDRYLATLHAALEPGGQVIIAAFAIGGPEQCSGLDIVQYDAAKLSRVLGSGFALAAERAETHITPACKEQRFGYFRFVKV